MPDNGRPTKLSLDVQNKIVQALQAGTYRQDAAEYAGVDAATLRRWMARGLAEKDGLHDSFRAAARWP